MMGERKMGIRRGWKKEGKDKGKKLRDEEGERQEKGGGDERGKERERRKREKERQEEGRGRKRGFHVWGR